MFSFVNEFEDLFSVSYCHSCNQDGYVVTNLNDSVAGSLRQVILDALATAGADTITFSVKGTILLSSTLPG